MRQGGTIASGCLSNGTPVDIVSAFQSYGEYIAGRITEEQRREIVRSACPGPGACGGMYTANSMASAIEVMGLSLPGSSSTPAMHPGKIDECNQTGKAIKRLLEMDLKPRDILSKKALENAMTLTMILGGRNFGNYAAIYSIG